MKLFSAITFFHNKNTKSHIYSDIAQKKESLLSQKHVLILHPNHLQLIFRKKYIKPYI